MDKKTKVIAIAFADLAVRRILKAVKEQDLGTEFVLHKSGSEISVEEFISQLAENNLIVVEEVLRKEGLLDMLEEEER